jgi:pimeloyl-ACP methyl ester carboxylesterase
LQDLEELRPATLTLADGRSLAYYEFGDPVGVPCVYTSGTPSSGLAGALYDEAARAAGVRWISVDKPGYGRSTFDPQRSLRRYSDDIRQLLDVLGLSRTAVAGESGGGPHVLAQAHDLPDRVTTAIVVAGLGPGSEKWVTEGMKPRNRRLLWLAKHAEWSVRLSMAAMARSYFRPGREPAFLAMMRKTMPAVDAAELDNHPDLAEAVFASTLDAFSQGPRASAQEFTMFARDWHFAIEDIRVPVHLWHGTEDVNVPVGTAREIARRLAHCTGHVIEGAGHLVSYANRDEIVRAVVER